MYVRAALVFTACLLHFVIVLIAVTFSMPPSFQPLVQVIITTIYSYTMYDKQNLTIIKFYTQYDKMCYNRTSIKPSAYQSS